MLSCFDSAFPLALLRLVSALDQAYYLLVPKQLVFLYRSNFVKYSLLFDLLLPFVHFLQ